MFIPHKKPAHDPQASLAIAEQSLKMLSIGMGEYTLDSISMMQSLLNHMTDPQVR